jgi:hypothetical protein
MSCSLPVGPAGSPSAVVFPASSLESAVVSLGKMPGAIDFLQRVARLRVSCRNAASLAAYANWPPLLLLTTPLIEVTLAMLLE